MRPVEVGRQSQKIQRVNSVVRVGWGGEDYTQPQVEGSYRQELPR